MPKKKEPAKAKEKSTQKLASRAQQWMDKINKDRRFQGKAQIKTAANSSTPYHLRRPTGILGLDLALGGGFHAGGPSTVYGQESAGKTYLTYKTLAEHQKIYGEDSSILIYSTEIRTDKGFARKAGVCVAYSDQEIDEFNGVRESYGNATFTKEERADLKKQIGDVGFLTSSTAEEGMDAIVDAIRSRAFHIIIVDSLGSLITKEEEEGDIGDHHIGKKSRTMTQFMDKVNQVFMLDPENETTFLAIDQVRAEIGGSPRGPKTHASTGAWAWKHGLMIALELRKGAPIREKAGQDPVGREVHWKLTKGKAGTHDGFSGTYNYYHVPRMEPVFWKDVTEYDMGGIDAAREAVDAAIQYKLVKVEGAWITWDDGDGNIIIKAQGRDKFAEQLAVDLDTNVALFRKQCTKASGLSVRWK